MENERLVEIPNDDEEEGAAPVEATGGEDAPAAEPATPSVEASGEEGAEGAEAPGGDDQAALPQLTDEQIQALAQDPRFRQATLGGNLDEIINELLTEREEQREIARTQAEQAQTLMEAYRKGEEDGDWEEFGKLAADAMKAQAQQSQASQQVLSQVQDELDQALTAAYGEDFIAKVDENKLQQSFAAKGLAGVIEVLREMDREAVRQELGGRIEETERQAQNVAAAAAARGAAVPNLPGGSATTGGDLGDDIGSLMREGLKAALADVEE